MSYNIRILIRGSCTIFGFPLRIRGSTTPIAAGRKEGPPPPLPAPDLPSYTQDSMCL